MLLAARAGWDMGLTLAWTVPVTASRNWPSPGRGGARAGFPFPALARG
jgi:putative peptidoglycan lipid II flippase